MRSKHRKTKRNKREKRSFKISLHSKKRNKADKQYQYKINVSADVVSLLVKIGIGSENRNEKQNKQWADVYLQRKL